MESNPFDKVLGGAREYVLPKGQTIEPFGSAGKFYYVKEGFVKRYMVNSYGEVAVQSIYGPGNFFPLTKVFKALLNQKIYAGGEEYFYETLTKAILLTVELKALVNAAQEDPDVYKAVLLETGRRLESNIQQLENVSFRNARKEIAHELVFLARHFGRSTPEGIELKVPLTQQDLSDLIVMSRETVSRQIAQLKRRGLLLATKRIVIPNVDSLRGVYEKL